MKLKESKGMSLIVFTIILAVLLIVAGGIIVYLLNNPVKEGTTIQTPTELQDNMANNEVEVYTETDKKDIKATIENYYKLLTAKENSPVLMLTDVMKMTVYAVQDPEYAPDNYVEHPDASKYMWTGIKYEDFRNNLWYITDNILKEKFSEFVEYKNYLYIENNDNNAYDFRYEITKQEINQSSTIDTCICDVTVKNSKTEKTTDSKITMSRGNGDFVIKEVVNNEKENIQVSSTEINIDKINSVLGKLDVVYGMEFTDFSKLSNKDVYFNLRLHLEKEGKISQTDSSNQKIKELSKEVFNKEFNGDYYSDYSNSDAGQGAFERKPIILGIEKENEKYTVTYTTIIPPDDGDVADKVYVYYKAELLENAEGNFYVKSNNRIEKNSDNKFKTTEINNIIDKLDVVYGMEFTDYSKLSNKDLYFNLRLHLEKEEKISQNDSSNQKIKELSKEVFDKEYNGDYYSDYSNSDAGQGAFEQKTGIIKVEKENEKYVVTYTTITPPDDGDVADKVYIYYKAELVKNAEGNLYIKSNTRFEEKIKDMK